MDRTGHGAGLGRGFCRASEGPPPLLCLERRPGRQTRLYTQRRLAAHTATGPWPFSERRWADRVPGIPRGNSRGEGTAGVRARGTDRAGHILTVGLTVQPGSPNPATQHLSLTKEPHDPSALSIRMQTLTPRAGPPAQGLKPGARSPAIMPYGSRVSGADVPEQTHHWAGGHLPSWDRRYSHSARVQQQPPPWPGDSGNYRPARHWDKTLNAASRGSQGDKARHIQPKAGSRTTLAAWD